MRTSILLAAVLVVVGVGIISAEDEKPDPTYSARQVLEGSDAEYKALRADLATRPNADLLSILDAVRTEAALTVAPAGGVPPSLLEIPSENSGARKEAAVLERALEPKEPWVVRVDAHLLTLGDMEAVRGLRQFLPEQPNQMRAIPAEVAVSLIPDRRAPGATRAAVLPPLELLDGQTGTLIQGAQVRYMMDYEVSGSMVYTAKPVLGTIREGVQISVMASRSQDRAKVNLKVHVRNGVLRRPVELFRTRLRAIDPERVIQLPELRVVELRDAAELPSGGWCVGRIRAAGPDEADQLLLMRALRLPPPTVMKGQPGAVPAPGAPAPGGAGGSCGK